MQTDYKALFDGIYWHQRWEIAPGIFTPGVNSVADMLSYSGVPQDLTGKRVLDVGAWNGCCSFEAERRGASEVIALGPEHPDRTGFEKLQAAVGSTRVTYIQGTIYDLQPDRLGKFDTIFCFGVLYHLRHLLLGLDMLRRVAGGEVHFETQALIGTRRAGIAGLLDRGRDHLLRMSGQPLVQFYRRDECFHDPSNWFAPNEAAFAEMLASSGFEVVSMTKNARDRLAAHTRIIPGPPEWMTIGSGEGDYYDVIMKPVLGSRTAY